MPKTCPICKRSIPKEDEGAVYRPFCSSRCKTIDLGSWLTEAYRISRPIVEEDVDESAPLVAPPAERSRQKRN